MESEESILSTAAELGLALKEREEDLRLEELAARVNSLLVGQFDKLIAILYRMDVSDVKLKQLLKDHPGEDAGMIVAKLMVERQAQKIRSRAQF
ncbi:MAG: hypothetical protein EOP49_14165, partial [Sphingobacteriales bacterium]